MRATSCACDNVHFRSIGVRVTGCIFSVPFYRIRTAEGINFIPYDLNNAAPFKSFAREGINFIP